jgi:aldoxime dehydratase
MEAAIPAHLRCPRTRDARASEDYVPPYPAWTARLAPDVQRLVMMYVGAQYDSAAGRAAALAGLSALRACAAGPYAPRHHDLAVYTDEAGYETLLWVAYWNDEVAFERWSAQPTVADWWSSEERLGGACGWFREVACTGVERFETLFSTPDRLEGAGRLASGLSGPIREHAYWGGMRDRLPVAQTDALRAAHATSAPRPIPTRGARVRVPGVENLALIRSGQEWTETRGDERRIYLQDVEPVLREGMDFLRDEGASVGCLVNRYMTMLDDNFAPREVSYGLSWWRSLEHMERWSESHPTHVAIFGTFMRLVQAMNAQISLRLYHEVAVLRAQDQQLEYLNCHPRTGLLHLAAT